jgi:type IX secretion system PorP/SprF family membrane protein
VPKRPEGCNARRHHTDTLKEVKASLDTQSQNTDTVKRSLLLLSLYACVSQANAQDIHFSQFFENAALRNPALTGIYSGDYKVNANYRSQWGSFAVPFQTTLISAETKALLREQTHDYLSFGLTAVHDKAGSLDFTSTSVYGAVNYNKALGLESKTYLSVGLCGGYIQRGFDLSKMRFASQFEGTSYNTAAPTGERMSFEKLQHWDASAGISVSGAISSKVNYYVGGAGYHVSKPQESFYDASVIRLTTRWIGIAGISARLPQGFGLTVHANYQYQDPYKEIIVGGLLSHNFRAIKDGQKIKLAAGCFYRFQDAIIPMVQAEYNSWALTMSYDVTASGKRMYLSGAAGYEISLSLRGNYSHKPETELKCPRFEQQLEVDEDD